MRAEGQVETRREGKRIYSSGKNKKVIVMLHPLFDLYCSPERDHQ